jgi:hypothetical protein
MRLKEMSAAKQAGGKRETEKGKQPAAQKKRTRNTRHATQTQPAALLAAGPFAAALEAVPAEDWCRTWAAGRTSMLRRTSKRFREVVDKLRLPTVVRLSRNFWHDARKGTERAKRQFVLRQLTLMTGWLHHRTRAAAHKMQRGLQECWRSAQGWLTSILETMGSDQTGQRGWQECCLCAQR